MRDAPHHKDKDGGRHSGVPFALSDEDEELDMTDIYEGWGWDPAEEDENE